MAMSIDLPVVDVRGAAAAVRQACVEHGFFYVSNHGVDGALLDAVFAESRRFFEQPTEGKMALRRGSNHRGYTPPYVKKLDAASQFEGDLKETFYIGPDLNQWPSEVLFPSWKDTMKLYQSSALVVGVKILSLIALSLDLDAEYFQKIGALNCPSAFVQLLCYPGEVNEADNGNFGASAHSDYGMITLLATDGTPGFRTLIVNIGDLLERWTNCLFRSTLHRVVAVGKERCSVAFFLDPNPDSMVQCFECRCSEANPPRFPRIRSVDYLKERISAACKL